MDAINREFLSFGTGMDKQTIKLKARRTSGARGFSSDCLLLDEAQILGKRAWGSIVPTMSARPNPQLWLFGTPPTPDDDAFAFSRVRESAAKGKPRHTWLEWSADPGDDFDAPETWAKANPAFGVRISYEACADDRAAMDDEQFAMERLGMWADATSTGLFPSGAWEALVDTNPTVTSPSFGVATAPDRSWSAICAAWRRPDGAIQLLLGDDYRDGTAWVAARAAELRTRYGSRFLVDTASRGLITNAIEPSEPEQARAHNALSDAVLAGGLRHGNEKALNVSVRAARWRPMNNTRVLDRKGSTDITPLVAASLALHGLAVAAPSVYEDRGLVTLG